MGKLAKGENDIYWREDLPEDHSLYAEGVRAEDSASDSSDYGSQRDETQDTEAGEGPWEAGEVRLALSERLQGITCLANSAATGI